MTVRGERNMAPQPKRVGLMRDADEIDRNGSVVVHNLDHQFTAVEWSMLHDIAEKAGVSKRVAIKRLVKHVLNAEIVEVRSKSTTRTNR